MRERFPRRNDSNLRHPHDNRNDKSQWDYSGPSRKHKRDHLIAAVDRPSRGKKSTMQEEFEKLLQKKCPWHLGANHAAIDCYHLRRTFRNSGGGKKNKKPVDKELEDDDQGDQGRKHEVPGCFKDRRHHLRGRWRLRFQAGTKTASLGDHVRRAGLQQPDREVMMLGEDWREAYIDFIWDQRLPAGMDARSAEAARVMRRSKNFILVDNKLYRRGTRSGVLMKCVTKEDGYDILREIYEGVCGNHAASRTLVGKAYKAGF
jgi:hypothetical protein